MGARLSPRHSGGAGDGGLLGDLGGLGGALGAAPLGVEEGREGDDDAGAAAELLAGLFGDAVDEFEVVADHPAGSAGGLDAAVEFEGGADGDHDAAGEVGAQAGHELLLLGGAEGYPDDVGAVGLDHAGDGGVVELFDWEEGELGEGHGGDVGVHGGEVVAEAVEGGLLGAEEYHAVAAGGDDVAEDLAAAVLGEPLAVDPLDVEGDVAAVADGEHAAIDDLEVAGVAVGGVEDYAVGHADVVGAGTG